MDPSRLWFLLWHLRCFTPWTRVSGIFWKEPRAKNFVGQQPTDDGGTITSGSVFGVSADRVSVEEGRTFK